MPHPLSHWQTRVSLGEGNQKPCFRKPYFPGLPDPNRSGGRGSQCFQAHYFGGGFSCKPLPGGSSLSNLELMVMTWLHFFDANFEAAVQCTVNLIWGQLVEAEPDIGGSNRAVRRFDVLRRIYERHKDGSQVEFIQEPTVA